MINIENIIEGWRNNLLPPERLKRVIRSVSRKRMRECDECEHNSKFHSTIRFDRHCLKCGCTLSAKTKCLSCKCPDIPSRWGAVLTDEQEEEMKKKNDNGR